MTQLLPWLLVGGSGYYIWKSDVPEFVKNWSGYQQSSQKNENQNMGQHFTSSQQQQSTHYHHQEKTATASIVEVSERKSHNNRTWFLISSTAIMSICAYYYWIHKNGTKQVISKVEDTAIETQGIVKECDENSEKRFIELDKRNAERADDLSAEVRGEQRAHFEVLSKQLYCVTQVCLQTLNAVANGITGTNDDFSTDTRLMNYSIKAQEMSDDFFKNEIYLRAQALHVSECQDALDARQRNHYITPGGGEYFINDVDDGDGDDHHMISMTPGRNIHSLSSDNIEEKFVRHLSVPNSNLDSNVSPNLREPENSSSSSITPLMDYATVQYMCNTLGLPISVVNYADVAHKFVRRHKYELILSISTSALVWKVISILVSDEHEPPNSDTRAQN